jgi:hypothetical protein
MQSSDDDSRRKRRKPSKISLSSNDSENQEEALASIEPPVKQRGPPKAGCGAFIIKKLCFTKLFE